MIAKLSTIRREGSMYHSNRQHDNEHHGSRKEEGHLFRLGVTLFFTGAALLFLYYIIFYGERLKGVISLLGNILMPIIVGAILAYILIPVLNFIEQKIVFRIVDRCGLDRKKHKDKVRGLSVALTAIFIVLVIYIVVYVFISQIIPSIKDIADNFDVYTGNIIRYLNTLFEDNAYVRNTINSLINQYSSEFDKWLDTLVPRLTSIALSLSMSIINILQVAWDFIIGFIISIYIMCSKDVFVGQAKKMAYGLFERETANEVISDARYIHRTFTGFLSGKIIDSIIIGIICFIGTSILKTPYAALVSLIIGLTNVIPFFGPFLGAVPCAFLIFVVAPTQPLNMVYFVIFILLLQTFDGNILGPKILGDSTGLSSFWVIFSITVFGGIFGIPGMIIGVPTFAVIFAAVRRYINRKLKEKELPADREVYRKTAKIEEDNQVIFKENTEE